MRKLFVHLYEQVVLPVCTNFINYLKTLENVYWKRCISNLINGIWIYTLAGIVASVLPLIKLIGLFTSGWGIAGFLYSVTNSESPMDAISQFTPPAIAIAEKVVWLFVLIGYILFFTAICRWIKLQKDERDRAYVCMIKKSYIMLLLSVICGYLPLVGWLASLVLQIVSYSYLLSGFKGLKRSSFLPDKVKRGAGRIWAATICVLVGAIISNMPIINILGSPISIIINIVTFFIILSGWNLIKNGAPDLSEDESLALRQEIPLPNVKMFCWFLITLFGLYFLSNLFGFVDRNILESGYSIFVSRYIFNPLYLMLFVAVFVYRKMHLSIRSKIGLGLMILLNIYSFFSSAINNVIFYSFDSHSSFILGGTILEFLITVISTISVLLLVLDMPISKGFKTVVALDAPLFGLRNLISNIWLFVLLYNYSADIAVNWYSDSRAYFSLTGLFLSAVIFSLVLYLGLKEIKKQKHIQ